MIKLRQLILIIAILIATIEASSQTYNIASNNGQTISTCSGTFYDSGGPTGGYVAAQTYTITFCPTTTGAYINLDFTSWNVGVGDNLEIFDGPNISSPSFGLLNNGLSPVGMVIAASILNSSGCLTLRWNSASAGMGWVAGVTCGLPCQNYSVSILSSTPPFHLDSGYYYIDLCPSDTMSITGTGIYGLNDSVYHQSDATTSFIWDMGNYFHDTIQTVTTVYDTIRGYNVELTAIDSNGCLASQTPKIRVRLSTKPSFNGTTQIRDEICQGDTTNLFGIATTKSWQANSSLSVAGQTYLPDGSGASYTSTLVFGVFAPGQVLQNANDILAVKATIEHSYMGDLNIKVTCPNGQFATLKSYPGGGATFLGEPIDNNSQPIPGIGYEYAWMPTGTTTMIAVANTYTYNFTDNLGNPYSNKNYLPPSTGYPANSTATGVLPLVNYLPVTPYTALVGCPMNGAWSITVTDNLFIDNGFIFSWGIDFAQSVLPVSWSYQPMISSQAWNISPTIVAANGGQITIMPADSGLYSYTYTVIDDFGCPYDTTLSVNVLPTPTVDLGNDTLICGAGIVTIDAGNSLTNSTYAWNTGNLTQTQITNIGGTYIATVSYSNGNTTCSDVDSMIVEQFDMANVNLGNDTCVNGDIVLYAGNRNHYPPFLYLWSDGSTGDSLLVTQPGVYAVTVAIDMNTPCTVEDEIVVSMYEPNFLGPDQEFCNFEEISVNVVDNTSGIQHQYVWSMDGATLNNTGNYFAQTFIPVGNHTLSVAVDNGCYDEVLFTSINCTLEIPNIITPNGDGINDVFKVIGLEYFENSVLIIYNRWGRKVYENNNYQNDWGDQSISEGVYYYVLSTTVGFEAVYRGTLTVLK